MDIWKYYDITHRRHVVCNPMSVGKLDELIDVIDLKPGAKVVVAGEQGDAGASHESAPGRH